MKKIIVLYGGLFVIGLSTIANVHKAQASSIVLTMPPILASPNVIKNEPPSLPPAVTMMCNGREWQRKNNGNKYCNVGDSRGSCSYDARKYCQDLNLGEHSQWYLPSRSELQNLATCSNKLPLPEGTYWSSTRDYSFWSGSTPHYFLVNLPSGESPTHDPSGQIGDGVSFYGEFSVLCVR